MKSFHAAAGYSHSWVPAQRGSTFRSAIAHGANAIAAHVTAAILLARLWRQRARDRALLARFDGRMLRDIGLTPADVMREINRPFWREC